MTVKDIVREWMLANGYIKLTDNCDCGCEVDDLMPCCGERDDIPECEPM